MWVRISSGLLSRRAIILASGATSGRRDPHATVTADRPLARPEGNTAAVRYLAGLGITAERRVTRMWLGAPPAGVPG